MNILLFGRPMFVWLGFVALTLLVLQIGIGLRVFRLPFWVHTKIVWWVLLAVVLVHGYLGFYYFF